MSGISAPSFARIVAMLRVNVNTTRAEINSALVCFNGSFY